MVRRVEKHQIEKPQVEKHLVEIEEMFSRLKEVVIQTAIQTVSQVSLQDGQEAAEVVQSNLMASFPGEKHAEEEKVGGVLQASCLASTTQE